MKSINDSAIIVDSSSSIGHSNKSSKVYQEPLVIVTILGINISHLTQTTQFILVSSGVFVFFLLYGYFLVSGTLFGQYYFIKFLKLCFFAPFVGSYICAAHFEVSWIICYIHSICVVQLVCNNRITYKKGHCEKVMFSFIAAAHNSC